MKPTLVHAILLLFSHIIYSNTSTYSLGEQVCVRSSTSTMATMCNCTDPPPALPNKPCFVDYLPPIIIDCPLDITVDITYGNSTNVTWTPPTAMDNCGEVNLTSDYRPGYSFPNGTTTVTYTATDPSGNNATCSFNVTGVETLMANFNMTISTNMTNSNNGRRRRDVVPLENSIVQAARIMVEEGCKNIQGVLDATVRVTSANNDTVDVIEAFMLIEITYEATLSVTMLKNLINSTINNLDGITLLDLEIETTASSPATTKPYSTTVSPTTNIFPTTTTTTTASPITTAPQTTTATPTTNTPQTTTAPPTTPMPQTTTTPPTTTTPLTTNTPTTTIPPTSTAPRTTTIPTTTIASQITTAPPITTEPPTTTAPPTTAALPTTTATPTTTTSRTTTASPTTTIPTTTVTPPVTTAPPIATTPPSTTVPRATTTRSASTVPPTTIIQSRATTFRATMTFNSTLNGRRKRDAVPVAHSVVQAARTMVEEGCKNIQGVLDATVRVTSAKNDTVDKIEAVMLVEITHEATLSITTLNNAIHSTIDSLDGFALLSLETVVPADSLNTLLVIVVPIGTGILFITIAIVFMAIVIYRQKSKKDHSNFHEGDQRERRVSKRPERGRKLVLPGLENSNQMLVDWRRPGQVNQGGGYVNGPIAAPIGSNKVLNDKMHVVGAGGKPVFKMNLKKRDSYEIDQFFSHISRYSSGRETRTDVSIPYPPQDDFQIYRQWRPATPDSLEEYLYGDPARPLRPGEGSWRRGIDEGTIVTTYRVGPLQQWQQIASPEDPFSGDDWNDHEYDSRRRGHESHTRGNEEEDEIRRDPEYPAEISHKGETRGFHFDDWNTETDVSSTSGFGEEPLASTVPDPYD